jgi:hypothetical protein
MGLKWLVFLTGPLYLFGVWFGEYQRANIIETRDSKKLDYILKNKLNSEYNWEDLCIQVRNQQTYTFNNHN